METQIFAGDKDKRLSVTGFCIYIYGCLVSWKSHGQKTVALSSTEAEYIAISELCAEILLIKSILEFLKIEIKLPIIVHCDNIGAIYLGHNAKLSQRTKHIDVKISGKRIDKNRICQVRRKRYRYLD